MRLSLLGGYSWVWEEMMLKVRGGAHFLQGPSPPTHTPASSLDWPGPQSVTLCQAWLSPSQIPISSCQLLLLHFPYVWKSIKSRPSLLTFPPLSFSSQLKASLTKSVEFSYWVYAVCMVYVHDLIKSSKPLGDRGTIVINLPLRRWSLRTDIKWFAQHS